MKVLPQFAALVLHLIASTASAAVVCNVSASTENFGVYNPLSASPADTVGNVQVVCGSGNGNPKVSYTVSLSPGSSSGNQSRKMTNGGNALYYNLYTNPGRSQIWGDGTSGTSYISDSYHAGGGFVTRNYPVYGRIPALQNTAAGTYADTITVTVIY